MSASGSVSDLSSLPLEALASELHADSRGLSTAEAAARLGRYGPNEIAEQKKNPLLVLAGYFWTPIPWMIEVALVLSLLVSHWTDAAIIAVLLAMNGLVAFVEEHQAANAIEALKKRLASTARVRRDGVWTEVPTRELVPGDVIRVRLGDVIPADARLLDETQLQVDQSALTGESLPVTRSRGDVLYSGAVITRGEGDVLVYATGTASFFGKTTALVEEAGTVSHFQRAVLRIGNSLIAMAVGLVLITLAVSLGRGNPTLQTLELLLVVTIASIPVALPAVLSVTMAVGARQLARRQAVVSHLPAVEELGGIDVLCTDKTGTLTQNRLAVAETWCAPGVEVADLLASAALASRAEDRDLIDLAVLAAEPSPGPYAASRVETFTPFDPVTKRTEASIQDPGGSRWRVSKGAPQVIAALCEDGTAAGVDDQVERFARRVGLGDHILPAAEMPTGPGPLDETLAEQVEAADGFAQVFPEHKYRIVELLQERGHIVGMTGDGVNDAPALKQADAGIAVSGATDAARAAADVVLLEPGLSVIVQAIALAREIFARMTSYAIYRIAETIRVLFVVVLAVVAVNFFPVTDTMIVLLAILNDAAILTIAYDHVRGSPRPAAWDMRTVSTTATAIGAMGVLETFLLFSLAHSVFGLDHDVIRTLIYLKLSVSGHLTIFVTRTRGPFWTRPAPARLLLGAVVGTQILATCLAVFGLLMTSISWGWAGFVWGYALFWFLVEDRVKLAAYAYLDRHGRPAGSAAER